MLEDIFDYETVNRTDYRALPPGPQTLTEAKSKPPKPSQPYKRLIDNHTLTAPKNTVPFSLFHTPKPIVRTDPRNVQQPFTTPSPDLTDVIATRPRLVITPAVAIDDVEPVKRAILIRRLYQSTSMAANETSGVAVGTKTDAWSGYATSEKQTSPIDIRHSQESQERRDVPPEASLGGPALRRALPARG